MAALLPDEPEFAVLVHGLARLGAVLVPLSVRWTAEELRWPIENTLPKVIVHAPDFGERLPARCEARRVVARTGSLVGGGSVLGGSEVSESEMGEPNLGESVLDSELLNSGPDQLDAVPLDAGLPDSGSDLLDAVPLDAAQAIIHTSGTTGRPKGAVLTWENQVWSALGSALRLGVHADDRWLAPLPLHHVGGLAILLRSAFYGTVAALPGRIDAAGLSEALERESITIVSLVPTQLARLLDARGDRPATAALRAVLLGGGPASGELLRRAHSLGYPLAPTYGLSEAASQVATCAPGWTPDGDKEPAAPPLAVCEVRVTDAARPTLVKGAGPVSEGGDAQAMGDVPDPDGRGHVLGAGEVGAIEVRGPIVMPGYWRDMEATRRAIVEGWLRTGDLGRLDAEGRLVVLGRRDDLIVSGGENIYPAEVEGVLETHPDVAACCVVGVTDAEWGEVVVAVIESAVDRHPDLDALRKFARDRLAGYKMPRRWVVIPELPRTASGKVRRGEVRRMVDAGI